MKYSRLVKRAHFSTVTIADTFCERVLGMGYAAFRTVKGDTKGGYTVFWAPNWEVYDLER